MKKTLIVLALLVMSFGMEARPVDMQRARSLVETHFFAPAVCVSPAEWNELYVFELATGEGFVIVSADDCTRPVLAYSLNRRFEVDSMPPHVADWIDGYRQEIASLRKAGVTASDAIQALWVSPKSGTLPTVEPLLTTTWNQSPLYNNMCPYSWEDGVHAVTGCVATAQAQIMKYWNHPAIGYGSHSYNSETFGYLSVTFDTLYQWDSMPNALHWGSTANEINAVAQLMHHIGVAVEMSYGVNSSGAYVSAYGGYQIPSSERSLVEHFRYSPLLMYISKDSYTDADWDSIMRDELLLQRPILYSGRDPQGGHAFVLDGCDSMGFFHVNWGWGGGYDGYYTTDSLSPGAGGTGGNATYTFNLNQGALIGIQPSYGNDSIVYVNAVSADTTMGTVIGNGSYEPFVTQVEIRAVAADGYRFAGWKSGSVVNPIRIIINGDFTDTALFVPLGRDTLAYCANNINSAWHDDYGTTTSWGIRIPASRRNPLRSLDAVQLFVREPGYYMMNLYYGDSIKEPNKILSGQYDMTEAYGWTTIDFDEPIPLVGDLPLYITFSFTSDYNIYPAAMSYYTGVSDGTWYKTPQGWLPYDQYGQCLTWMIRAYFVERPCYVAVEDAGYCNLDNLYGAGFYALGESVTVGCNDPDFNHWEGIGVTSNELSFIATGDTAFYAYCHDVGVEQAEADESVTVEVVGHVVTVEGPCDAPVQIYDMQGRLLASHLGNLQCMVPSAGVYVLRVGQRPARKIVIME